MQTVGKIFTALAVLLLLATFLPPFLWVYWLVLPIASIAIIIALLLNNKRMMLLNILVLGLELARFIFN